jgi:hypothetical protein
MTQLNSELLSTNWSGVILTPASSHSFATVSAEWTIPQVSQVPGQSITDIAEWVGLDGYNSSDVCQAGVNEEVVTVGGRTTISCSAWDEWYPAGSKALNVAVAPGNTVSVTVATGGRGSDVATITFDNVSTGKGTTVTLIAPGHTSLVGNSAEFICETPELGTSYGAVMQPLACDFTPVIFSSAVATYAGGGTDSDLYGTPVALVFDDRGQWTQEAYGSLVSGTEVEDQFTPWWQVSQFAPR